MQILVEGEPIEIIVTADKGANSKIVAWKMSQQIALISTQFIRKIEHEHFDTFIVRCYFERGNKNEDR